MDVELKPFRFLTEKVKLYLFNMRVDKDFSYKFVKVLFHTHPLQFGFYHIVYNV